MKLQKASNNVSNPLNEVEIKGKFTWSEIVKAMMSSDIRRIEIQLVGRYLKQFAK